MTDDSNQAPENREPTTAPAIRARDRIPNKIPQPTFQEAKSASRAIADGHTGQRWHEIEGEEALRHVIPGEPHEVKLTPGRALLDWWGFGVTREHLWKELERLEFDAVILLNVCLALIIRSPQVTVTLDDLVNAIGWRPRRTPERDRSNWRSTPAPRRPR